MKSATEQNVMLEDRHPNCCANGTTHSLLIEAKRTRKMHQHRRQQEYHFEPIKSRAQRKNNTRNVLISFAVGLLLAVVHSNALISNPAPSPPASTSAVAPTTSSSGGKPASLSAGDQSSNVNLIPVDQPVGQSSSSRPKLVDSPPPSSSSSFEPAGNVGLATGSLRSASDQSMTMTMTNGQGGESIESDNSNGSSSPPASSSSSMAASTQAAGGDQDEFSSDPTNGQQYYSNENFAGQQQQYEQQKELVQQEVYPSLGAAAAAVKQPQQQADGLQRQQMVERRFGLFKKGQHYGSPMTANYASAGPYLSDCERCLANLGQQSSADLQQLEPLPPMVGPLPPPPPPQPTLPSSGHFGAPSSFGPLKSKLFMKFPFFVKPIGGGGGGLGEATSGGHSSFVPQYWPVPSYQPHHQPHHHHQPTIRPSSAMSNALFIRPQAPAYNCIQTSPPLVALASASQQAEISQYALGSPAAGTKSSSSPATKGAYPHQQNIYSSSSY